MVQVDIINFHRGRERKQRPCVYFKKFVPTFDMKHVLEVTMGSHRLVIAEVKCAISGQVGRNAFSDRILNNVCVCVQEVKDTTRKGPPILTGDYLELKHK